MNKTDLVERGAAEHELTRSFARELVESVLQTIIGAARGSEEVSLFGFGRFKVAERVARKGRNPRTGEAVKIAASKALRFTPARSLKTSLDTKRRARKSRSGEGWCRTVWISSSPVTDEESQVSRRGGAA